MYLVRVDLASCVINGLYRLKEKKKKREFNKGDHYGIVNAREPSIHKVPSAEGFVLKNSFRKPR